MGNRSIGIQRGAGQRGFRIAYFKVRREYADRHPIPASRTNEGAGSTPPPCDLSDLTDARRSPSVPSATQLPLQRQVLLPSLSDRLANAAAATRAPSDRGGHVGRTRPAERVDRALEHIQLLGRNGHLPWRARLHDRRAEAAEAESIDAAPVEERRRALPHELNLLLVLQRREQRGDPLGTGERRQAAAAVVDELRRLRQVATAPDQPLGPQQVVHLRRVERVLTGPVLGPAGRILAAGGQPAVADVLEVALVVGAPRRRE